MATPKAKYISTTLSIYTQFENFPNMKIFPLILAENPIFPDWKKFSKFSLFCGNLV